MSVCLCWLHWWILKCWGFNLHYWLNLRSLFHECKTCVCTLDTASWGDDTFADVCRHFSIFPTTQIYLLEGRGPGVQRGSIPQTDVVGALILPVWGAWVLQGAEHWHWETPLVCLPCFPAVFQKNLVPMECTDACTQRQFSPLCWGEKEDSRAFKTVILISVDL